MPVFDHFSWIAPRYDRLASAPDVESWRRRLGLPAAGLLLDVGGGTGRISHPLRGLVDEVVLADPSAGMAHQAAEKPGLRVLMAESEGLPFPPGAFARILMVDALHHVADQSVTARELVRVLAPGGRLLIEEPDIRRGAIKIVAVIEKLLLMRSRILSAEQVAALFSGLPVRVSVERQGTSMYLTIDKER